MFIGNILTSIDLIFYIIIGIAVLFGFLRGFKKSLFNFIFMALFYLIFFLTLQQMVNMLWSMNLSFLGSILGNIDQSLSTFQSFENDYQALIQVIFNNSFDFTNAEMDLLAVSIIQFVLKIVWAILYFTVILLIYKIITGILRAIFVKNKKGHKKPLLGAIVGGLNGLLAVFILLILLGGTISFLDNVTLLMDEGSQEADPLYFSPRDTIFDMDRSIIDQANIVEYAEQDPLIDTQTQETIISLIDNYQNNIIVKLANGIKVTSAFDESEEVPLHINLFDQVLSFEYQDNTIALRHEVSVFTNAYAVVMNSDYADTGKITDIDGQVIREAFSYLETSILLPTALPIGIKYFAEENDINLSISDEDLYDYDYSEEIGRLSNILAGLFDILNEKDTAIDEDGNEVTIDRAFVVDIFEDVSESRIILLATESILVPQINESEGILSQMIEVPDDWSLEYIALGDILAEMVEANVSISTIESADATTLLSTFAQVDTTVLLDSSIITNALINVLNQETDIEGLDVLEIPQNIQWESTDSSTGELEYILLALNAIIDESETFDFSSLDVDFITNLSETTISTVLDSYIIRATITAEAESIDLGSYQLVVPDDATGPQGYYTKTELMALIDAIQLLADDLDQFDLDTLFTMDESEYQDLFSSTIIRATITNQLSSYQLNNTGLTIPTDTYETSDYLYTDDLIDLMLAIKVIYDDLDTFTIESLYQLTDQDYQVFFESKVIRGTITTEIESFDLGGSSLMIPDNLYETSEYLNKTEMVNLMKAISSISGDVDTFTLDSIYLFTENDLHTLFASGIMQATISQEILDLALANQDPSQLSLIVPNVFRQSISVDGLTEEQIEVNELVAIIMALNAMNLSNFDGGIDPSNLDSSLDFTTIFESGSMHVSMDNLIDSNTALVVPDLAMDNLYGLSDIIIESEIIALIDAVDALSSSDDITNVSFTFTQIQTMDASQRDTVLTSMIVRKMITPDAELAASAHPTFSFDSSDYMLNMMSTFLTKQAILDLLNA